MNADAPLTSASGQEFADQRHQTALLHTFKALVEYAPDAFVVTDMQGILTYVNPAFKRLYGYGDEALGMHIPAFFPESEHAQLGEMLETILSQGEWQGVLHHQRKDGSTFVGQETAYFIRGPDETPLALAAIIRDVTAQQQAEQELRTLQEQVIAAQQAALAELSTPLIPITNQVMVMPLIGAIDSQRAQQVITTLLQGIADNRAQIVILDITGVPVVDTQVANALIQAAQSVALLGAQVILTGIRPEVAQTLVGLGVDLAGILTANSLQSGIALAIARS